jgi:hypothetical protein
MKRIASIVLGLVLVVVATSCTIQRKTINQIGFQNLEISLQPNQYEIIGDVEGTGKSKQVIFFLSGFISAITGRSIGAFIRAKELAEFEAVSKARGADVLISPRYEVKTRRIPLLLVTIEKAEVTIYAKAVRLIPSKN